MGISIDSVYSHVAWQKFEVGMLKYPLASDFFPHGKVAQEYGVFRPGEPIPGISDRAVFVITKDGEIVFSKVYELRDVPDNEEPLAVLRQLKAKAGTRAR